MKMVEEKIFLARINAFQIATIYHVLVIPRGSSFRPQIILKLHVPEQNLLDFFIMPAKENKNKHSPSPPVQYPDIEAPVFVKIPDDIQHLIRTIFKFISLTHFGSFGGGMDGSELIGCEFVCHFGK